MSFNQPGEVIEIHQANRDIRAIRLITGLAGEAAGRKIDSPVTGTKCAKEAAHLRRTDDRVLAVLFSLSIRFAKVLGQRNGTPHEPHPAGALQIANALGVAPANCVIIGDSTFDIETATNAVMNAIAVASGYHDRTRLLAAGATRILEHPCSFLMANNLIP